MKKFPCFKIDKYLKEVTIHDKCNEEGHEEDKQIENADK